MTIKATLLHVHSFDIYIGALSRLYPFKLNQGSVCVVKRSWPGARSRYGHLVTFRGRLSSPHVYTSCNVKPVVGDLGLKMTKRAGTWGAPGKDI